MSHELIAEQLKKAMGLHSPTVGMVTVSSAIEKRMRICEINTDNEYLMRICSDHDEMKELIEAVIIPETWFFREPQPYPYILDYLQKQNINDTINILSIPCSTGEEPYSIAMMLMDNNIHDSRYQIDAIDIASKNIEKAIIGEYRKNSFRSEDQRFIDKHFKKNGSTLSISDTVKKKINFNCKNILTESFSLTQNHYDVIFCRNLLIYFDPETQQKMFSILGSLLTPNGLLVLGHAETAQNSDGELVSIANAATNIYVKKTNTKFLSHKAHKKNKPLYKEKRKVKRPIKSTSRPFADIPKNSSSNKPITSTEDITLGEAFELANKGELDAALEICTTYIENNSDSTRAYYLSGVIYDTKGKPDKASEALHKAIYLDPDNLEALIHLSLMAEQRGEHNEAMKFRNRAQRVQERRAN